VPALRTYSVGLEAPEAGAPHPVSLPGLLNVQPRPVENSILYLNYNKFYFIAICWNANDNFGFWHSFFIPKFCCSFL